MCSDGFLHLREGEGLQLSQFYSIYMVHCISSHSLETYTKLAFVIIKSN